LDWARDLVNPFGEKIGGNWLGLFPRFLNYLLGYSPFLPSFRLVIPRKNLAHLWQKTGFDGLLTSEKYLEEFFPIFPPQGNNVWGIPSQRGNWDWFVIPNWTQKVKD